MEWLIAVLIILVLGNLGMLFVMWRRDNIPEQAPQDTQGMLLLQNQLAELTRAMDTKLGEGDFRSILPRFTPEAMEKNQALVDLLKRIAGEKNATPAQIALAWLLSRKPWIVPIPGTTKLHRLEENLAAADVDLTPDDLTMIERAAAEIQVEGERYPAHLMATTGR